jgi:hypothetical protein
MEMNELTRISQERRRSRRRGRFIVPIADLSAPAGFPEYWVQVHHRTWGEAHVPDAHPTPGTMNLA